MENKTYKLTENEKATLQINLQTAQILNSEMKVKQYLLGLVNFHKGAVISDLYKKNKVDIKEFDLQPSQDFSFVGFVPKPKKEKVGEKK